ncbi:MAG: hypothetical protein NT151_04590 [Acidobacteria bacterium]|nr:hypothetical protein [Acidobacteriota bacterium]
MSRLLRPGRVAILALLVVAVVVLAASPLLAQGLYYKEIAKDGRIYVFNSAARADAFETSGEMGVGITKLNAGPNGETVIGDSERALQLFFFKHGMSEAVPEPPPPPPPAPSPDKFSGLMFGDYYYFKNDNVAAFNTQQGFWFRRMYFTYDRTFSPAVSMRFRLEADSNGKLTSPTAGINPYIKDAWVKWAYHGKHQVTVGIQPTPNVDFNETLFGLRHIEKTPEDLYRIDSSRDFGVSLSGPLNQDNTLQYTAQFANDSGNNSEIDKYKAVRFAVRYVTNPGFVAEGFYGYYYKPLSANRLTLQAIAGYQTPQGRVGIQYLHHTRQPNEGTTNPVVTINVVSGFGVWIVKPSKFSVFGRFDHSNANPDAAGIDYLPIYKSAPFNLGIAGIEYYIHPSVRFSPNIEWVNYGTPLAGATAPARNDMVFRVTWFWTW